MTIQNAVNQILGSATIGAGLYAHSPTGKAKAETRDLTKAYEAAETHRKEWEEPLAGEEAIAETFTRKQAERAQRLYELNPTEANYERAAEDARALANIQEDYAVKKGAKRAESRAANLSRQRNTVQFYDRFGDMLRGGSANG